MERVALISKVLIPSSQASIIGATQPKKEDRAQKTVAIIGAGIAGLAAATKLQKAGFKVIILEQADRIGGRIASI
ncbi:MAG: FAD-dependent oxidoreductase [Runella slithyformis]|nr:MAG: FAD-dependent oxidoreductase [Runella slithyformis]